VSGDEVSRPRLLLSALAAGLAGATSYGAGVVIIAPLWVAASAGAPSARARRGLAVLGLGAGTFAMLMPWVLLAPDEVLVGINGAQGFGAAYHPGYLVTQGWGPVPLSLVVLGAGLGLQARRRRLAPMGGFALLYALVLGASAAPLERDLIPLMPVLFMLAGCGASALTRRVRNHVSSKVALPVLVVVILGWPAMKVAAYVGRLASLDTRSVAREWVHGSVPRADRICTEAHAPPISPKLFEVVSRPSLCDGPASELVIGGCDYVVVSDATSHPERAACYDEIFNWDERARFDGEPLGLLHDPTIRIFRPR
jgi:hypothetical protein